MKPESDYKQGQNIQSRNDSEIETNVWIVDWNNLFGLPSFLQQITTNELSFPKKRSNLYQKNKDLSNLARETVETANSDN